MIREEARRVERIASNRATSSKVKSYGKLGGPDRTIVFIKIKEAFYIQTHRNLQNDLINTKFNKWVKENKKEKQLPVLNGEVGQLLIVDLLFRLKPTA